MFGLPLLDWIVIDFPLSVTNVTDIIFIRYTTVTATYHDAAGH